MEAQIPPGTDPDLRRTAELWTDFVAALRRSKTLIALAILGTVIGAYSAVQLMTELYEARTSVLVKLGRENVDTPATVQNGAVMTSGIRREEVESEMRLLGSRALVEETIDRLGPDAFTATLPSPTTLTERLRHAIKTSVRWAKRQYDDLLIATNLKKQLTEREKAISAVESALVVEREKDSDVITARLRLASPELGVRVLDTLLLLFLDRHIAVRRDADVKGFFDTQVTGLTRRLTQLEDSRATTMKAWKVSSIHEQRTLLLKRLQELRDQVVGNEAHIAMLEQQHDTLATRLATLPNESRTEQRVDRNPSIQSIKERMTSLQMERSKSVGRYLPGSDVIRNIERELASLEEMLTREAETLTASVTMKPTPMKETLAQQTEEVRIKLAGLKASTAHMRAEVGELERLAADFNTAGRQLETIERERKIAEENYVIYVKRLEEARISEELDRQRIANIAILSPPTRSLEPVYPRKLLIMALSLPAGLVIAIGLALLRAYGDDALRNEYDLARIGALPYLGTVRVVAPANGGSNGSPVAHEGPKVRT